MSAPSVPGDHSPYIELDRSQWQTLRKSMPQVLSPAELEELRGVGEDIDIDEVSEVYLPLSRLIDLRFQAMRRLNDATETFLGEDMPHVPFIIGVSGSVAVGKSTTARLLQVLLQRWESRPRVDLITTDGFLYPASELNRRHMMGRKGYPESYDQKALLKFVTAVKSGAPSVPAPVYSHEKYDRLDEVHTVDRPDILIVEGLNVLQTGPTLMVSDLFDFSVYVDARMEDVRRWYVDRFLSLRRTAFADPQSYFKRYADLSDDEARATAHRIWDTINGPNLAENVITTRGRADLVLRKGADHQVSSVLLRRL